MYRHRNFKHDLLAAALLALCCGTGTALAGQSDETTIVVRTEAGTIERIDIAGELAPGERRALSTKSGNPATLARTEKGLTLEVAGEQFEIPHPGPELAQVDEQVSSHADGTRKIVIRRDKEVSATTDGAQAERKVIVKLSKHEGGDGDAHADAHADTLELDPDVLLIDPSDPELALAAAGGKGKRVIMMRRIKHDETTQTP
jgi:hypothetical protein